MNDKNVGHYYRNKELLAKVRNSEAQRLDNLLRRSRINRQKAEELRSENLEYKKYYASLKGEKLEHARKYRQDK